MTKRLSWLLPALVACAISFPGQAAEINDALLALPVLGKPEAQAIPAPGEIKQLAPGVSFTLGERVVLGGSVIIDQGPADGLEVFACLQNGKTHESILRLSAEGGQMVNAAFIAALAPSTGVGSPEDSGLPARGTPLRVVVRWADPDKPTSWWSVDASCLVRDRITDKAYPPLPFIYTGSRFMTVEETDPNGNPVKHTRYMLDSTKSVVDIYDEGDALLASPFPGAGSDKHFEVNSSICPPVGTVIQLDFQRVELPLMLSESADGEVHKVGNGTPALTDDELGPLLVAAYGVAAKPNVRAVGILVSGSTERARDAALRLRLLKLAGAVKAWVVPVFIPSAAR